MASEIAREHRRYPPVKISSVSNRMIFVLIVVAQAL